jgi:tetratricopeptide (TPR) repeat protein
MADMHMTREMLEALARGEIPVRMFEDTVLEHLRSACPDCKGEVEDFTRELEAERSSGPGVEAVSAVLERHLQDFRRCQERARRDVETLLTLPREERIARIKSSRTRYRGPQIAWILLEASRLEVSASPAEAEHLAELARLVIECSPGWQGCMGLLALATAHRANACRATGRFDEAEGHLRDARSVIAHEGFTDMEIFARIDCIEGLLQIDLGDSELAGSLLRRAALLFSTAGESVERSRTLIKLGLMYFGQGELTRAVETIRAGLQDLPSEERDLYLCGRYNLALSLIESGQYGEADEILWEDKELHQELPARTQLLVVWLRGKIAAGYGDEATAEEYFLAARAGFFTQQNADDPAANRRG